MGRSQNALQFHMFCNNPSVILNNIGSREGRYVLQLKRPSYVGAALVVVPGEAVDKAVAQKSLK